MANIIDRTYFDGGLLNISGTELSSIQEKIGDFISVYETEYLKKVLGYPLWKLFNAQLPAPADQRYKDILNGVEFTDANGNVEYWIGLKDSLNNPIAMYVWFYYEGQNASYSSTQGEQKGKTENASNVSVITKQVLYWNKMKRLTDELWEFLYSAKTAGVRTYPEFDICKIERFGILNSGNL